MFDLNVDPGEGNLNLRAYIASIVGPRRIAHGQRMTRRLRAGQVAQIGKNSSRGQEAFYVGAWMPSVTGLPVGVGYLVGFSSSETTGETADLVTLLPVAPGQQLSHYGAVLLADEQLYASIVARTDGVAIPAGTEVPLIVSQVAF